MTEKQLFYPLLSVYFSLILGDLQKEKLQIVSIFRFGHKKRGLFQCPPSWFDGKDFSEWPVFPCWGMYFRNIGQVKLKSVTLQLKGKDYRTPIIYDNVHKKPSTSACNIITKNAK